MELSKANKRLYKQLERRHQEYKQRIEKNKKESKPLSKEEKLKCIDEICQFATFSKPAIMKYFKMSYPSASTIIDILLQYKAIQKESEQYKVLDNVLLREKLKTFLID